MAEEKLLTIREVALLLGISEKEVIDLAENGTIPAYKIGGVYLRFKRQQIEEARRKIKLTSRKHLLEEKQSIIERIKDFFYFNDFYIVAVLIIAIILLIIFQG
jgi:excisionase family DNA binding protein